MKRSTSSRVKYFFGRRVQREGVPLTKAHLRLIGALNGVGLNYFISYHVPNTRFEVDLLLLPWNLPIEIDGGSHSGKKSERNEKWKDDELVELGFPRPERFTDEEVFNDLKHVLQKIWDRRNE